MRSADTIRRIAPALLASPAAAKTGLLLLDAAIAGGSFYVAMALRFEGRIAEPYATLMVPLTAVLVGCRIVSSLLLGLHCWSFRLSGLADAARIWMAGLSGTGLFLAFMYLFEVSGTPRSVVILELLLSTLTMAAARFSPRLAGLYVGDFVRTRRRESVRTLIVGAESAGEMLLRDLQRSGGHNHRIIGFVDDDQAKRGMILGGQRVLGSIRDLPALVRRHGVEQLFIAIPGLEGRRVREILTLCADMKLRFKILPYSFAYFQDRPLSTVMQDLSPDDLLMRDPIRFEPAGPGSPIGGRIALVTGAAGSIGSEICLQLLQAGLRALVMVDINENGLYLLGRRLAREFPEASVHMEVADLREARRIASLFRRHSPHLVFHAAAHKHVPLMEAAPCEAVKNNVLGTLNVAFAARARHVERFVYISTDKAVRPASVMGATKRVGEEIVRWMARRSQTRFCAVRFGNVLGSAGSVVPLFREQIFAGGPVTVTHPEVRRYFMTISEAVALVLEAACGDYGELCVLDMGEQIRIADLARHMITMAGFVPGVDIAIAYTGLRPGEKLSEELLTEDEESTRRVSRKILVADCPAPALDLDVQIGRIADAAAAEDAARVLALLQGMLPSYRASAASQADAQPAQGPKAAAEA